MISRALSSHSRLWSAESLLACGRNHKTFMPSLLLPSDQSFKVPGAHMFLEHTLVMKEVSCDGLAANWAMKFILVSRPSYCSVRASLKASARSELEDRDMICVPVVVMTGGLRSQVLPDLLADKRGSKTLASSREPPRVMAVSPPMVEASSSRRTIRSAGLPCWLGIADWLLGGEMPSRRPLLIRSVSAGDECLNRKRVVCLMC